MTDTTARAVARRYLQGESRITRRTLEPPMLVECGDIETGGVCSEAELAALCERAAAAGRQAGMIVTWPDEVEAADARTAALTRAIAEAREEALGWRRNLQVAAKAQRLEGTETFDILGGVITAMARISGLLDTATPAEPDPDATNCPLCERPFAPAPGEQDPVLRTPGSAYCERCLRSCRAESDHACGLCAPTTSGARPGRR